MIRPVDGKRGIERLDRTHLGSVERGERNVAIDNIWRIAWALDVELKELLA